MKNIKYCQIILKLFLNSDFHESKLCISLTKDDFANLNFYLKLPFQKNKFEIVKDNC